MLLAVLGIIFGVFLLYFGAEGLIKGGVSIALRAHLSRLLIGLTIVAYGTSSPELVVSVESAIMGHADLAIGNVIGSNIANIALILGIAALLRPLHIERQVIKFEMPIVMAVSILFTVLYFATGSISRFDGFVFVALLVFYTWFSFYMARRQTKLKAAAGVGAVNVIDTASVEKPNRHIVVDVLFVFGGLALLTGGAHLFIDAAIFIARSFGISEAVIGLTIVAVGTSLPELAASIVAAYKNQMDIAVGNIVGSNIYNILAIIGISALIHPLRGNNISFFDFAVMLGVGFLFWLLIGLTNKLQRWHGVLLLLSYGAYIYWLWPKAS